MVLMLNLGVDFAAAEPVRAKFRFGAAQTASAEKKITTRNYQSLCKDLATAGHTVDLSISNDNIPAYQGTCVLKILRRYLWHTSEEPNSKGQILQ